MFLLSSDVSRGKIIRQIVARLLLVALLLLVVKQLLRSLYQGSKNLPCTPTPSLPELLNQLISNSVRTNSPEFSQTISATSKRVSGINTVPCKICDEVFLNEFNGTPVRYTDLRRNLFVVPIKIHRISSAKRNPAQRSKWRYLRLCARKEPVSCCLHRSFP